MNDLLGLVFWVAVLLVSGAAVVYFAKQVYRDWRDRDE